MNQEQYVIDGGQRGRERLRVLARTFRPTTVTLLHRVGLSAGMYCLDAGCGGGDVSLEMARVVGVEGRVRGFDFDAEIVNLARQDATEQGFPHIEFQVADALELDMSADFALVYARFLLTHLPDPARGLSGLIRAAKPGGTVVVEDIDFDGHFCYPPSEAFDKYVRIYSDVVRRRCGDARLGIRLPKMFLDAGLADVQVNVVQPTHLRGEGKTMAEITMTRIGDAVTSAGLATREDVEDIIASLAEYAAQPDTLISVPRIVQVWGTRVQ